ncbi:MAG: CPBP family intramembrane glutamic endopeptidase [Fuerstiella sp.]
MCFTPEMLAQAALDPKLLEVTPGRVLSGLLVLSCLAASAAMIIQWAIRLKDGRNILPAAQRKPLCVPLPLLVGGILLSVMMAISVLEQKDAAGPEGLPPTSLAAEPAAQESTSAPSRETTEPVAMPSKSSSSEGATGAATGGETGVETGTATATAESPAAESDDDQTAADAAETGADNAADAGAGAMTEEQFIRMVLSTLIWNGIVCLIFGATILVVQQNHSRSVADSRDLSYGFSHPASPEILPDSDLRFPDLDAPPPAAMAEIATPYAVTSQAPLLNQASNTESERWNFRTELRFAAETFLAAYLPTAVLRIIILSMMPEVQSHPFLEMMDTGVSWVSLTLIAVMAIVVAPVAEELLYRVTILGGLMQQRSLLAGWVLSSVMFSFAHGFPDSVALLPLAFAIGYAYIQRRSYRTVVLVHFLFNGFNMVVAGVSML